MSFALLSGAGADFPPEMEFENAVGTGLGGLAVLFSENPVGGDDGTTAFTVGLFDRSADGGPEKVGDDIPVALVASDDPVTGRVVSGPDGGFLVMIRSVEGAVAAAKTTFDVLAFDALGEQTGQTSTTFDGKYQLFQLTERARGSDAPDWIFAEPFRGELLQLSVSTGVVSRIADLAEVSPGLALSDGTLVDSEFPFLDIDFSQDWAMRTLPGTGPADVFRFSGLGEFSGPSVFASGQTLAALTLSSLADMRLIVAKPGETPDAGVARIRFDPAIDAFANIVAVKGVGYLVVGMQSDRAAGGLAQTVLVDFDGDVIQRTTFAGLIDPDAGDVAVATLERAADDPIRLALLQEIAEFDGAASRDVSKGEVLTLSPKVDVTGTTRDDLLLGFDKDDEIRGAAGNDSIAAGAGDDLVLGGAGRDRIDAGAGTDQVEGGDDAIFGEGGADRIAGGFGADDLTGGGGRDRFEFESLSDSRGERIDEILDFSRAQGDRIVLKDIDAKSGSRRHDAFRVIGDDDFHGRKGELRAEATGDGVFTVQGDVNGDGVADLEIAVTLATGGAMGAGDFIL
ncbi:calcium-binding protein [Albimonas sp. CAU 1670]|uniref:calcium-binding protein n=1 Tax=Albimonas sp. CAU 1670 TaxID=3032599 RepID=UPI0023DA02B8|nr:calcium-binding protein [Albimonas sp. CAU 1670]MDF2234685.1 calcium-binding protein [Albimonas sp. CAU 1670]